jgi:medium-chain acyl-[acyl-carrier-protein] hydrolase
VTPALVPLRATGSEPVRLVAFSPAGMGTGAYQAWISLLPQRIGLWGVRLPGRESRFDEPVPARMPDLIAPVLYEIRALPGPVALFGHSFGALAAYAAAAALPGRVTWLGLSGMDPRAPELPRPEATDDELFDEVRRWGGVPPDLAGHLDLIRPTLAALRGDLAVARDFLPVRGPAVDCPVTLFGGADDPAVSRERLLGWRPFAAAELELRMYAGGHFHLVEEPHPVVADLDGCLHAVA